MSIQLNTRQVGDVVVPDAAGRIVMGDPATKLRDTVCQLAEKGHKRVVLNLADVAYIDCSGLGELIAAGSTRVSQGEAVKLLNLTERVLTVFHMTKLHTVLPIFDNEQAALTSLN